MFQSDAFLRYIYFFEDFLKSFFCLLLFMSYAYVFKNVWFVKCKMSQWKTKLRFRWVLWATGCVMSECLEGQWIVVLMCFQKMFGCIVQNLTQWRKTEIVGQYSAEV